MINDYIHMNSVFSSPALPSVVFGAKTPTTTVGDTQDPPHSVLLPSEPIKGPDNTQLPFRQLLPSSPSEEERGLREGWGGGRHELSRNTYICTHILHLYTPPPPHTPHPHTCTPPFHALSLCGVQVPRSGAKSRERRGGEGRGRRGYSCIFLFLVWFVLRPIYPKEDTDTTQD